MTQRVMTAYGPGVVVESSTVRGRTSHRVQGEQFDIWVEAAAIADFGEVEWDAVATEPMDNSTTLPYNPQPQFYPHSGESTIQPNQHLDSDKRLSPADSVSFRPGTERTDMSHLFAPHTAGLHTAADWTNVAGLLDTYSLKTADGSEAGVEMVQWSKTNFAWYIVNPQGIELASGFEDSLESAQAKAESALTSSGAILSSRHTAAAADWVEVNTNGQHDGYSLHTSDGSEAEVVYWRSSSNFEWYVLDPMGTEVAGGYEDTEEAAQSQAESALRANGAVLAGHTAADANGTADTWEDMSYPSTVTDDEYPGGTNTPHNHDVAAMQERLGDKYVDIPIEVDHSSIQARLDDDPYRVVSEMRIAHLESRRGLDPKIGKMLDLEEADPRLKQAAWADVRAKATRLRRSGAIALQAASPVAIVATVTGDHGTYEVAVVRGFESSGSVSEWSCSCPWGDWAFERQATYVGRLCSHAYAALQEHRALNMRKDKPQQWKASSTKTAETAAATLADFEDWVNTSNGGIVDLDAARQYLFMYPDTDYMNADDLLDDWYDTPFMSVGSRTAAHASVWLDAYLDWCAETGTEPHDPDGYEDFLFDVGGDMDQFERSNLQDAIREMSGDERYSARTAAELHTRPQRLTPVEHYIPQQRGSWPTDLEEADPYDGRVGFLSEPFEGSGGFQRETFPSSEDYVDFHERPYDDVEGPGINPVMPNGDDVMFAAREALEYEADLPENGLNADGTDDPDEVDVMDPDDVVANFQKNAGYLMESSGNQGDDAIAAAAEGFLRTAGRQFTLAEQQGLIDEEPVGGPLSPDELDLRGTHYMP